MEVQELAALEERIRAILSAPDLQWILASVDAAIGAGLSSEKSIIIRKGRGSTLFGDEGDAVAEVVEPGSRQRPQRVAATNEPLTQLQRVTLFIAALRRAAAELPLIQDEAFKILSDAPSQSAESVRAIQFLPDEDSVIQEPPRLADLDDSDAQQQRLEALRVLEELDAEVIR